MKSSYSRFSFIVLSAALAISVLATVHFIKRVRAESVKVSVELTQSVTLSTIRANIEEDLRLGLIDDAIQRFNVISSNFSPRPDCVQLFSPDNTLMAYSENCPSNTEGDSWVQRSVNIITSEVAKRGFKVKIFTDASKIRDRIPFTFWAIYVIYGLIFTVAAVLLTYISNAVFKEISTIVSTKEVRNEFVGSFSEVLAILRLVREQELLKSELSMLTLQAAQTDLARSIALQVSHDIRSPLSAIETVISMVALDQKYSDLLRKSSKVIRDIADNLLSNSAAESGYSKISCSDAIETTNDFIKLIYLSHPSLNIAIIPSFSDIVDKQYRISKSELHRCLDNLVRNSIHACLGNRDICISIDVYFEEKTLKVSVIDNGHGFSKSDSVSNKNVITDIGTQRDSVGTQYGFGIGLKSVQRIVDQVGGNFEIDQDFTGGAKILLSIPSFR